MKTLCRDGLTLHQHFNLIRSVRLRGTTTSRVHPLLAQVPAVEEKPAAAQVPAVEEKPAAAQVEAVKASSASVNEVQTYEDTHTHTHTHTHTQHNTTLYC
ncbi:hypothetical protein HF521_016823 [Silurus meridionalis]|uniref:Uncharacterized protein n=1 Tax=Silurus meridionalis TaxID=175797 RepID=A0A8T0BU73_SILME|nr:hypothetical protein HF521_016823 [Silurus meridionalis]